PPPPHGCPGSMSHNSSKPWPPPVLEAAFDGLDLPGLPAARLAASRRERAPPRAVAPRGRGWSVGEETGWGGRGEEGCDDAHDTAVPAAAHRGGDDASGGDDAAVETLGRLVGAPGAAPVPAVRDGRRGGAGGRSG